MFVPVLGFVHCWAQEAPDVGAGHVHRDEVVVERLDIERLFIPDDAIHELRIRLGEVQVGADSAGVHERDHGRLATGDDGRIVDLCVGDQVTECGLADCRPGGGFL